MWMLSQFKIFQFKNSELKTKYIAVLQKYRFSIICLKQKPIPFQIDRMNNKKIYGLVPRETREANAYSTAICFMMRLVLRRPNQITSYDQGFWVKVKLQITSSMVQKQKLFLLRVSMPYSHEDRRNAKNFGGDKLSHRVNLHPLF